MPTEKQRREAARRHLERQLQRRQEREARRKRVTLIASVAGTLLIIGVVLALVFGLSGGSGKSAAGSQPTTTPSATAPPTPATSAATSPAAAAASYPCTWTKGGAAAARKVSAPATTKPPKAGAVTVNVSTTQGNLTLTLNRKAAPCTVASFVSLAQQGYYDNTPCHRLTTTGIYVLQCGDPTGTGTGGPGYTIPDEFHSTDRFTPGVLAMANTGAPHSGGGQFFIVWKASQLPPKYTIFGTVTAGLPVVDKVAAKGATPTGDGKPNVPISLKKLTVRG